MDIFQHGRIHSDQIVAKWFGSRCLFTENLWNVRVCIEINVVTFRELNEMTHKGLRQIPNGSWFISFQMRR